MFTQFFRFFNGITVIKNVFNFLSQNEKNLERRHQLLSDKLRDLMLIDEFYKTEDMKTTESILLNELLDNVVERNNLVLQMDEENKL